MSFQQCSQCQQWVQASRQRMYKTTMSSNSATSEHLNSPPPHISCSNIHSLNHLRPANPLSFATCSAEQLTRPQSTQQQPLIASEAQPNRVQNGTQISKRRNKISPVLRSVIAYTNTAVDSSKAQAPKHHRVAISTIGI
jgi:hypothetical protein